MVDSIITIAEKTILVVVFSVITLIVFVNVVSRYLLHASIAFSGELVINLAVVMIMVGASLGIKYNTHPGFTVFRDGTKGLIHKVIVTAITLALLVFIAFLFWYGFDAAMKQFETGRSTPALGIPQGLFTLSIPFASILMTYRSIQQLIFVYQGKDLEEEPDHMEHVEEEEMNL